MLFRAYNYFQCGTGASDSQGHGVVLSPDGYPITPATSAPIWSPDGQQLLFASNGAGTWDIYRMRFDGTKLTRLTSRQGDELEPVWVQ